MVLYMDELYHHGVKGQKWGVRRYQNPDGTLTAAGRKRISTTSKKIASMYDHSNKWTKRKIEKLDKKGKTAKADVMRLMVKNNEQAKKEKIANVKKMSVEEFNKARSLDRRDALFGGQRWMANNKANMNSFLSRFGEYKIQRGMRWCSNFTANSTLARMTPAEGYDYLKRKQNDVTAYAAGSRNPTNMNMSVNISTPNKVPRYITDAASKIRQNPFRLRLPIRYINRI